MKATPIHEAAAREFCAALSAIARNAEALDNLESYLSYHFQAWLQHYCTTPEGITEELQQFAGTDSIPF